MHLPILRVLLRNTFLADTSKVFAVIKPVSVSGIYFYYLSQPLRPFFVFLCRHSSLKYKYWVYFHHSHHSLYTYLEIGIIVNKTCQNRSIAWVFCEGLLELGWFIIHKLNIHIRVTIFWSLSSYRYQTLSEFSGPRKMNSQNFSPYRVTEKRCAAKFKFSKMQT